MVKTVRLWLGYNEDEKRNIFADGYKGYMTREADKFIKYFDISTLMDVEEEDIDREIMKMGDEWLDDSGAFIVDLYGNFVDPYAEENENTTFLFADGTGIEDTFKDVYYDKIKEFIKIVKEFLNDF